MVGIVSYGAYVPIYRLSREEIGRVWGTAGGKGEKAVANCDESLGFCEKGSAKDDIDAGTFTQEGILPVNMSGGLKSFGHPIGASGCRMVYEIYKQIQGKAEDPSRQLKNPRLGLAHCQGGQPGKFMCSVIIVGSP
jgi:acetyl-CoA acetyltransferase